MKALSIFVNTVMVLIMVWFMLSWCDIVADNCSPNPVHHSWNVFVVMTELVQ